MPETIPSVPAGRRRRRWTAIQKAAYLARFARSGLSVGAFLRQVRISRSTFTRWRRSKPAPPRRDPKASFATVELVRASGVGVSGRRADRSEPRIAPSGTVSITMVVRGSAGLETELSGLDAPTALALLRLVVPPLDPAQARLSRR